MPKRADMFVAPEDDPRADPPSVADERTTLVGFLEWQRQTLELKCAGLTDDELAPRSIPPSTMSLLGLVRHLADVERSWFRRVMAGEDVTRRYRTEADADGDFNSAVASPAVVAEAWTAWRSEVAFAESVVASAADLDVTSARDDPWRGPMSLRWILLHMIEEYARHLGHADLLREQIDGALGQ